MLIAEQKGVVPMALDPSVDIGRKVWRSCTHCPNADGLYLLKSNANLVYVQCPLCHNTWWLDTGFGRGGGPDKSGNP
jgi:hypothetical protein